MKWFTYCDLSDYAHDYEHKFALIFGSDCNDEPVTPEEVRILVADPKVRDALGSVFFAYSTHTHSSTFFILSRETWLLPLPDHATLDTPSAAMYVHGVRREYNLKQRYADCRSLFKAVGCAKCPDNGDTCRARQIEEAYVKDPENHGIDKTDFKHKVTKIGDFTFASPVMTHTCGRRGGFFQKAYRSIKQHDFKQIDYWTELRSDAAGRAAGSRRFKKHQCAKCILHGSCDEYRHCTGRYPTALQITKRLIHDWQPHLKQLPKGIKPWQFWVIAHAAGTEATLHRRAVVLSGMHWYDYQFKIQILRSKVDPSTELLTDSYDNVAEIFNLPRTFNEAKASHYRCRRPANDLIYALWLRSLGISHVYSRGGWSGTQRGVAARIPTSSSVDLLLYSSRRVGGQVSLYDHATLYQQYGLDPGVPKVQTRGRQL